MLNTLIIALSTAQLVAILILYHKLSKAVQSARHASTRNSDNVITQVESLLSIYTELHAKRGLPRTRGWAASPDLLALLIGTVQQRSPRTIVECSSGLSTLILAGCMRNLGRGSVLSLEHDEAYARKTRALLELHGLCDWATVVHAPLCDLALNDWRGRWYDLAGLPDGLSVDLLVIDGPPNDLGHLARYPAVPLLYPHLSDDAVIMLDDADRDAEKETVRRWLAEYTDLTQTTGIECEKGCVQLARTPSL